MLVSVSSRSDHRFVESDSDAVEQERGVKVSSSVSICVSPPSPFSMRVKLRYSTAPSLQQRARAAGGSIAMSSSQNVFFAIAMTDTMVIQEVR